MIKMLFIDKTTGEYFTSQEVRTDSWLQFHAEPLKYDDFERDLLDFYLESVHGILTAKNGKLMLDLPEVENLYYESKKEMFMDIANCITCWCEMIED